ncbi:MAG: tRNA uridine-5-carboxymethylaminomethyl(34) synthesis enzyme MnmG, partial [Planctomycetes bacterium]|nr:tRNA uridine-5-carboxymethylaminomethyl(34) synthesis enzyme MnmG [Planctomycetota bacterium]
LTPLAVDLGMLESTALGRRRADLFARRRADIAAINDAIDAIRIEGTPLSKLLRRPEFNEADLRAALSDLRVLDGVWTTVHADRRYQPYIARHRADTRRLHETESRRIPREVDYHALEGLRSEAAEALTRFRPDTFGQAGRLEGVTPADLTLLSVHLKRLAREPGRSPVRTA